MNTNSNTYTIVYTSVVVILAAAILAVASQALKPKQDANVKADTISQMMQAAQYATDGLTNDAVLDLYKANIKDAFLVNASGERVGDLDKASSEIFSTSQVKAQNSMLKRGRTDALKLPVYVFDKDGQDITVIPCYGAGLWGDIWGYIALQPDRHTIAGAFFNHASETPGLGAKIKDDPSFRGQFPGKTVELAAEPAFEVIKGGAPAGQTNAVDAISGATMTSRALGQAISKWLGLYKAYLNNGEE